MGNNVINGDFHNTGDDHDNMEIPIAQHRGLLDS